MIDAALCNLVDAETKKSLIEWKIQQLLKMQASFTRANRKMQKERSRLQAELVEMQNDADYVDACRVLRGVRPLTGKYAEDW